MEMENKIKYMDIKEFRETGFLFELNRLFLHPLGLALEVSVDEDGTETLGGVWDYRDDDGGIIYSEDIMNSFAAYEKNNNVKTLFNQKAQERMNKYGYVHQPITGNIDSK